MIFEGVDVNLNKLIRINERDRNSKDIKNY